MRVTFDSNVWQMVVTPSLASKTALCDAFQAIHQALCGKQICGFICETVATLEAVRVKGRKTYFGSLKLPVEVRPDGHGPGQVLFTINVGTNHDQHPGLPDVLRERLELAFRLGIRLMRAPRIGLPIPRQFLDLALLGDEFDVPTSAARDNHWGDVVEMIEQRGVGSAVMRSLGAARKPQVGGEKDFARAVAEWADGDSVAAHIAYGNEIFCTEDQGHSTSGTSILDAENRRWLARAHKVKFATIRELATQVAWTAASGS